MARPQILQWDPDTTIPTLQEVRFGKDVPVGLELVSATVMLEQQTDDTPITWDDRTTEITITGIVIVDDTENDRTNCAVQFKIIRGAEPSEPESGRNYRYRVEALRDDGNPQTGKPEVHLLP